MAGVARNMTLAVRERGVDVGCDAEHVPRHILLRIVVAGEIAGNVAVGALNAERCAERSHRLLDIGVGRQHSEILWRSGRRRRLLSPSASAFLSQETDG